MKKNICNLLVVAFLAFLFPVLTGMHQLFAAEKSVKDEFELGKALIEKNNYDAMGATQKGMEEGMRHVMKAISMGVSNQKEAMLLLADSYDQMPSPPAVGSSDDQKRISERNKLLTKLFHMYPDDLSVLRRYADRVAMPEAKRGIYKKIVALNKADNEAHFLLSVYSLREGDIKIGLDEASIAIQQEKRPSSVRSYIVQIADELMRIGCPIQLTNDLETTFIKLEIALASGDEKKRTDASRQFAVEKAAFLKAIHVLKCKKEPK